MTPYTLGIDPGASGGLALLDPNGGVVLVAKMPETDLEVYALVAAAAPGARAVLEYVRSSPQMGVVSAFSFGRSYGGLRMALAACGIPYDEVTPAKWQGELGCRSKGDKNVTKARAQALFPMVRVTHATADALLLAEWGRRRWITGHLDAALAPTKE